MLNPYQWAHRDLEMGPGSCPETLETLARTCNVRLLPDVPTLAYRVAIELMAVKPASHRR